MFKQPTRSDVARVEVSDIPAFCDECGGVVNQKYPNDCEDCGKEF